ncbi:hypothetical protein GCK32_009804 [Trichostrongylus colubriformis]|uniref:BPTI/Kunitz inhibitor domain-containing protein n=1 Tax=Trichostrongylus colubriformis TaxID=6319 RepID=A0AAN8GD70_TRICO
MIASSTSTSTPSSTTVRSSSEHSTESLDVSTTLSHTTPESPDNVTYTSSGGQTDTGPFPTLISLPKEFVPPFPQVTLLPDVPANGGQFPKTNSKPSPAEQFNFIFEHLLTTEDPQAIPSNVTAQSGSAEQYSDLISSPNWSSHESAEAVLPTQTQSPGHPALLVGSMKIITPETPMGAQKPFVSLTKPEQALSMGGAVSQLVQPSVPVQGAVPQLVQSSASMQGTPSQFVQPQGLTRGTFSPLVQPTVLMRGPVSQLVQSPASARNALSQLIQPAPVQGAVRQLIQSPVLAGGATSQLTQSSTLPMYYISYPGLRPAPGSPTAYQYVKNSVTSVGGITPAYGSQYSSHQNPAVTSEPEWVENGMHAFRKIVDLIPTIAPVPTASTVAGSTAVPNPITPPDLSVGLEELLQYHMKGKSYPPTEIKTAQAEIPTWSKGTHQKLNQSKVSGDADISPCHAPMYGEVVIMCVLEDVTCPERTFCQIGDAQSICCPILPEPQCEQPLRPGVGPSTLLRWYFDTSTRQCNSFIFRGFQGNQNNFDSPEECELTCLEDLDLCEEGYPLPSIGDSERDRLRYPGTTPTLTVTLALTIQKIIVCIAIALCNAAVEALPTVLEFPSPLVTQPVCPHGDVAMNEQIPVKCDATTGYGCPSGYVCTQTGGGAYCCQAPGRIDF